MNNCDIHTKTRDDVEIQKSFTRMDDFMNMLFLKQITIPDYVKSLYKYK